MSFDSDAHARARRKALRVAVGALCTEVGFGIVEDSALETLTEMLQSVLTEIGRASRSYAELSGRTEVMVTDVVMAVVDQGINVNSIPAHAKRVNKSVFIPPGQSTPHPVMKTLEADERMPHPPHIPDYLPPFPDPHTYIRTETYKQPMNEYQVIREKAASQRRDVERALTRFIAKTGKTQSLFKDDASAFPLIAMQPHPQPYLGALFPKDQDLDPQQDSSSSLADSDPKQSNSNLDNNQGPTLDLSQSPLDMSDPDAIDNPYLRPVKMPRFKRKY
ncbi:hypothetical protein CHS0354_003856 [Potamilus streckersoni]|uniref:Transcription initiation factor TFIID subunit 8 n=1 Tax=Potamilus streckersoni TaxID=2493646 RepID=A0AAE0VV77_9BIVA|nr:hypothetical protein CHS0354_003856 [Potamilus streckersoni]